jgi:hypothetical protein
MVNTYDTESLQKHRDKVQTDLDQIDELIADCKALMEKCAEEIKVKK